MNLEQAVTYRNQIEQRVSNIIHLDNCAPSHQKWQDEVRGAIENLYHTTASERDAYWQALRVIAEQAEATNG